MARGVSQVLTEPMAWNVAPTSVTRLPNGVRVATQETFSEIPSVGVFIDAGVRSETQDTAGAAKLVEQLLLSGTAKFPKAKLQELEARGASIATSLGREQTSIQMSCFKPDVKMAVDILADMVANPGIGNLDKEKAGIIAALESADTPTRQVIDDRLHLCAFRDSSLGYSTLGPFEHIQGMTQEHLKAYTAASFSADKVVLAASGPVKHAEMVQMAEATLGGLRSGSPVQGLNKPYFCGAELNYRNDEMGPTAFLALGWEGVPLKSADSVAFMVMKHIIGSYNKFNTGVVPGVISGNRVINAVANKMNTGCADEFEAFSLQYKDTGIFGFYAACDEVAVEHCIGEVQFGINGLAHSVTEEETERGKRELKTKLAGATSSEDLCREIGTQMLAYGRHIPAAEMILRIEAIDCEEVKRVAWKYLADAEVAVTALGPTHGLPQYLDLRRATSQHRY